MPIDSDALKIVEEALALDDSEARAAFVEKRCVGNPELLARVQQLLALENSNVRLTATESFVRPMSIVEKVPDRVGPYRVTGEIARGGMGAVVKAERDDGVFEQTVAIKLIRGDLASDRTRARFNEERRILARLNHPGIVRIIDGGEADGRAWLAMDYIAGKPITEALDHASNDARLDAFEAVCEAVAYAHRNLVIHADIKPSNVLMTADGKVHLLDFGIARLIVGMDEAETGDPYPLTKGYAAPERGVGVAPTIASDIFSLGVLLLGILGRRVPGENSSFVDGTRLPAGELDGDLAAIAAKALAEDPDARYHDVTELLSDLRHHRSWEPIAARANEGWRYHSGRFILRHRKGLLLSGLAALALTATSIIATVSYVRAEHAREEADRRFVELRGLAQFMLTELSDRLSDAPGTVAARARMAEVAGRYLERLSAVPDAPLDLRLDTARGFIRLARLQGLSGTANLGQPVAAAKSLDRARAILDALGADNPDVLSAKGDVAISRWSLAADTDGPALTADASKYYQRALSAQPKRLDAQLGLLLTEKNHGFDLIRTDRSREAKPLLRSALSKVRAISWPMAYRRDARLLEASLLAQLGDATYYAGDLAGALAVYRESKALILAELARAPSLVWEEKLGEAAFNISGTLGETPGREKEAMAEAESGIAALRKTLSFGQDAAIEMRLIILLGQQSLLLDEAGDTRGAATASANGIALRRQRLAAAPTDTTRQRDLAIALAGHADIIAKSGNRAAACDASRQGTQLLAQLRKSNLLSARDIRIDIPKLEAATTQHCRAA